MAGDGKTPSLDDIIERHARPRSPLPPPKPGRSPQSRLHVVDRLGYLLAGVKLPTDEHTWQITKNRIENRKQIKVPVMRTEVAQTWVLQTPDGMALSCEDKEQTRLVKGKTLVIEPHGLSLEL